MFTCRSPAANMIIVCHIPMLFAVLIRLKYVFKPGYIFQPIGSHSFNRFYVKSPLCSFVFCLFFFWINPVLKFPQFWSEEPFGIFYFTLSLDWSIADVVLFCFFSLTCWLFTESDKCHGRIDTKNALPLFSLILWDLKHTMLAMFLLDIFMIL